MPTGEFHWTLGWLIGMPLGMLVSLILLAATVLFFLNWKRRRTSEDTFFGMAAIIAGLFFALALPITIIAAWPFSNVREFHALNVVTGHVETVNKRLVSDGDKSMSERFVIKFTESDVLYGCDDTRCSLATPGKELRILCTREWQYQAASGWGCVYGQEN